MSDQQESEGRIFRRRFNDRLVAFLTPVIVISISGIATVAYHDYERGVRVEVKLNAVKERLIGLEEEVCDLARELREGRGVCDLNDDDG